MKTPRRVWATKKKSNWKVNWCRRIGSAVELVKQLSDNNCSISDLCRPELWRQTDDPFLPYIYVGFHGIFSNPQKVTQLRRRIVVEP
jgi:hypothetical protein